MSSRLEEFRRRRERLNEKILATEHLGIRRFFNLDTRAYEPGALDVLTKEMMGLTASMVLRCNDCIDYHVIRCVEEGATDEMLFDAFNVSLVVGGSIVIPHLRHAVETLEELRSSQDPGS